MDDCFTQKDKMRMMKVRNALCAQGLAAVSFSAHADCYGTGSNYFCNDASGNSYNVSKYGNSTQVNGYIGYPQAHLSSLKPFLSWLQVRNRL